MLCRARGPHLPGLLSELCVCAVLSSSRVERSLRACGAYLYREAAVAMNGGIESKLLSLKAASVYIRIEQNITDLHHLFLPPLHFSSHAFCAPLMCGSRPYTSRDALFAVCLCLVCFTVVVLVVFVFVACRLVPRPSESALTCFVVVVVVVVFVSCR